MAIAVEREDVLRCGIVNNRVCVRLIGLDLAGDFKVLRSKTKALWASPSLIKPLLSGLTRATPWMRLKRGSEIVVTSEKSSALRITTSVPWDT